MKINIDKLVRPEVRALNSYQGESEAKEYWVNLSGNESPYDLPLKIKEKIADKIIKNPLNYYPTLYSKPLRSRIADHLDLNIGSNQVIAGNGSDDVLKMLIDTFISKGDRVLALAPTFSMYRFFTELAGGEYENFSLIENEFSYESIMKIIDNIKPKMIFLCSPNNPTGKQLPKKEVLKLIDNYKGILVIDEAYADFSNFTFIDHINQHTNLVVSRTFSKAFGLAGIRLGYLVGSKKLVRQVEKVLKPYNLNCITSLIGEIILEEKDLIDKRVEKIVSERKRLFDTLESYNNWTVFPSSANFVYIEGEDTVKFKNMLNAEGIKIRSFNRRPPAIRITVGKIEENDKIIEIFNKFKEDLENE